MTDNSQTTDPDETEGRRLYRQRADSLARADAAMAKEEGKAMSKETVITNEAIASRLSCELDALLPVNPESERKRIIYDQVLAVLNLADRPMPNDFPKLGIKTDELRAEVETLIASAGREKENMGAVNWGDIGVADIEYRLSMLHPENGPSCVVVVEEASPDCYLQTWLNQQLENGSRFPNTYVDCEW